MVANMTLVFKDKNSVPSASSATSQLESELTNSTSLNVIPGSVSAGKSNKKNLTFPMCGFLEVVGECHCFCFF